jgi:diguanylate cyclase (GGDEF)-like protein
LEALSSLGIHSMTPTPINVRDFPDSAYALELNRRTAFLRFAPSLEAEYSIAHLARVRRRVRVWFTLAFIIRTMLVITQLRRTGVSSGDALIYLGAILPCSVFLLWLAWGRHFGRLYLRVAPILVPLFYALIAVVDVRLLTDGRFEQFAAFPVVMIAVFFFAGLKFREAAVTALFLLITFCIAAFAVGLAPIVLLKCMVVVAITSVVGAIVGWDVEQSHRENFIERALIGELLARDSLTGLHNRRIFDEHLLRVWQQALRDQCSIAVCMIDVDHFKRYNDAFGHQAGDMALRALGRLIQEVAHRPLDLTARYGGEEFAVIFYDLEPRDVHAIAQGLIKAVQAERINPPGVLAKAKLELTISIGVGLISPAVGRTPQGAVQLADEALYEAKNAGRNRLVVKGETDYRLLSTGMFKAAP